MGNTSFIFQMLVERASPPSAASGLSTNAHFTGSMSSGPFTALATKKRKKLSFDYKFHIRQVTAEFTDAIEEGGEYVLYMPYTTCFNYFRTLFTLPSSNFGISVHPQIKLQWNRSKDDSDKSAGTRGPGELIDKDSAPRRNPRRKARGTSCFAFCLLAPCACTQLTAS